MVDDGEVQLLVDRLAILAVRVAQDLDDALELADEILDLACGQPCSVATGPEGNLGSLPGELHFFDPLADDGGVGARLEGLPVLRELVVAFLELLARSGESVLLCDVGPCSPPSPTFEAERIVAGFGGRDAVIAAVDEALGDEEFAWAARLVNYLFRLDPWDTEVRERKATALREMGQRALGSIARSFFIGQARALEGTEKIPTVVVPDPDEISQGDIGSLVDNFRIFVDPERSATVDKMLSLQFTDADDATFALIVRRGVCEFVADPAAHPRPPDLACSLTRLAFAELFTGEATAHDLTDAGRLNAGEQTSDVVALLEVFEPLNAADNNAILPPHLAMLDTEDRQQTSGQQRSSVDHGPTSRL